MYIRLAYQDDVGRAISFQAGACDNLRLANILHGRLPIGRD
jgi:hypothetical protein